MFYICLAWFRVAFGVTVLKFMCFWYSFCKVAKNQGFCSDSRYNFWGMTIYIYIYIYIYICYHENNVPSRLSSQWLCGNSCTWANDVLNQRVLNNLSKEHNISGSLVPAMCNRTSCAQVHELPQSDCGDNREGTLFSR